jgi:hypothetical protein
VVSAQRTGGRVSAKEPYEKNRKTIEKRKKKKMNRNKKEERK